MFEKLSNFTVSVSMLKTRSNEVQYSVLLTSANESISLILTVDTNQSDVISYLNSFIKDTSNQMIQNLKHQNQKKILIQPLNHQQRLINLQQVIR